MRPIRTVIVEDERRARVGLRLLVEADPENAEHRADLATAVAMQLRRQPELVTELAVLLKEAGAPVTAVNQTNIQTGNDNQSAQIVGDGNTVNLGRKD